MKLKYIVFYLLLGTLYFSLSKILALETQDNPNTSNWVEEESQELKEGTKTQEQKQETSDDNKVFVSILDTLYGSDWEFTKAYGLFDGLFRSGSFNGYDIPQFYTDIQMPLFGKKSSLILGRFYNPGDYEGKIWDGNPLRDFGSDLK